METGGKNKMVNESPFKRRVGTSPVERGCAAQGSCPDVLELQSGDFAIIGTESTATLARDLPVDAGCGADESIVVVPREVLLATFRQFVTELGVSL